MAREVVHALRKHDIAVRLLADEAAQLGLTEPEVEVIGRADGDDAADDCELAVVIGGDGTILRAAEATHAHGTPLLGVNLGHVGFLAEAESDDLETHDRRDRAPPLHRRGAAHDRRRGLPGRRAGHHHLGAQRGQRREGRPGADARGGRRDRRPAAVALGLRRRGLRDPDRLHGLQLLRRRTGRLARRRGTADGADQRARAVRPAAGGGPDQRARRRGADRRPRARACCGATAGGRSSCRPAPGSRYDAAQRRCGWPGCTRRRSPTGWWPSSTCPVDGWRGAGAAPAQATNGGRGRRCSRSCGSARSASSTSRCSSSGPASP